jgi:putative ABC transport system substrate-binding protein
MKRRDFITLIGGAAAAWPLAARAQQGERVRRIGVLLPATADNSVFQSWVGSFLQELTPLGWTIGRNLRVESRWATTNTAEIRRHAAELAALAPDVIVAHGTSTVIPLRQAAPTVPAARHFFKCPLDERALCSCSALLGLGRFLSVHVHP